MDLVIRCPSLPRPGQTIAAESAEEVCGGKGANQAVAAARAGGSVEMIGRVGDDGFAERLTTNLAHQNVHQHGVASTPEHASGLAIVAVEASGQNAILIVPGANAAVSRDDVARHQDLITSADILLLQLEVPEATVLAAAKIAKDAGVRCILDPAPVPVDWNDGLLDVDLVCPNETEAAQITGLPVDNIEQAKLAAENLRDRGAVNVIITMGGRGSVVLTGDGFTHVPPASIEPVDTTAAGDAYAGALAVRWAETDDLVAAARFAGFAGAIAATRRGAGTSLATRPEIIAMEKTA